MLPSDPKDGEKTSPNKNKKIKSKLTHPEIINPYIRWTDQLRLVPQIGAASIVPNPSEVLQQNQLLNNQTQNLNQLPNYQQFHPLLIPQALPSPPFVHLDYGPNFLNHVNYPFRIPNFNGPSWLEQIMKRPRALMAMHYDEDQLTSKIRPSPRISKIIPLEVSMNFLFNYFEPKSEEQEIPCLLSLQGHNSTIEEIQNDRPGLDLVCVIDSSGSMQGQKSKLVKQTLRFMLTILDERDRLSLCIFNNHSSRLLKLTVLNERGKSEVLEAIKKIRSSGGTNLVSGLETGLRVLHDRRYVNDISAVLFLSDGVDDNKKTVIQRYKNLFERINFCSKSSFIVHTFGYGKDHDSDVMQKIANKYNGNFYYVEKPKSIYEAFASCLGELVSVVAEKIHVSLETQPCSIPFHLSKVFSENGDLRFTMPSVFSGTKKDIVFMLKFPAITEKPLNQKIKPVKAIITYENSNKVQEIVEVQLEILITSQITEEIEIKEDVMVNFYRLKSAEFLKEIANHAEAKRLNEAKEIINQGIAWLQSCPFRNHAIIDSLIMDFEDAKLRVMSHQAWEQGGRAQLNSIRYSHQNQQAASNAMVYQNSIQGMFNLQATNFLNLR